MVERQPSTAVEVEDQWEVVIGPRRSVDRAQHTALHPGDRPGRDGQFGVGAHIYFNEWFGLQFELRDYIVGANPGGLDTNGDRILNSKDEGPQNNLFFGVGLTFMLPPTARQTR